MQIKQEDNFMIRKILISLEFMAVLAILVVVGGTYLWAAAPFPVSQAGQTVCNGGSQVIYSLQSTAITGQSYDLTLVPITANVVIWVAPYNMTGNNVSLSGMPLATNGVTSMKINGRPGETWYCLTSGNNGSLGYTIH
jgi:hypothetical protein